MKGKKTKSITFTFLIIILLILSSFESMGSSTEFINDTPQKIKTNLSIKNIKVTKSSGNIDGIISNPLNVPPSDDSGNIIVSNQIGNESYPSMVVSGFNTLIAYEYEDNSIYFRTSDDYGENWSASKILDTTRPVFYPSLCIRPNKKNVYGTFFSSDNNFGIQGTFEIPDITDDLNNVIPSAWDWSDFGFYNFSKPDIVYHYKSQVPWIICSTGSTTYEDGPANETLMFFFSDYYNPGSGAFINWDPALEYCSNVSITMDDSSEKMYGICEIMNGTNYDLIFFYGTHEVVNENNQHMDLKYINKGLNGSENLMHPQIFFHNNKIYIIAESDIDGVVLFRSPIGTIQFTRTVVNIPPFSSYPLIQVNDTLIFCSFINNGNIFLTTSTNGINWDTPIQLNSQDKSVVEKYRFADFPNKNLIVWTDNREGNNDIYLNIIGRPEMNLMVVPDSVGIESEGWNFIPTKNRIKFTIRNLGEATVERVKVSIQYFSKGTLKPTEYPGTIIYLEGGSEETLNRPLFRFTFIEFISALMNFAGIEYINVTVDPDGKYKDVNLLDNTVSIPVDYEQIFPVLKALEQIFI